MYYSTVYYMRQGQFYAILIKFNEIHTDTFIGEILDDLRLRIDPPSSSSH